jgi:hypothetical protein
METIFGHLATRFASHPENLATEGLHFVLSRSAEARRLLLQFLAQSGCVLAGEFVFETQAPGDEGGIPDLIGRDASGAEPILVESKFWAGLTERQPVAYIGRVPPGGLLLFVAPARRFESLWPELLARCRAAGKAFDCEGGHGGDWRVARLDEGRRLALTSWRALLGALHAGLLQAGELAPAADVLQLQGLAERMDAEAFLPLSSEELTSALGTRIVQFCGLVDGAVERLAAQELADTKGCRSSGGRHGSYSRFFRMHQAGCRLYFNPVGWSQHGVPIWLEAHGSNWKPSPAVNETLRALGGREPPRLFVSQWGAYVPIRLPTGAERDGVLAAILAQLLEVADLLRLASSAAGTGPTAPPTATVETSEGPPLENEAEFSPQGSDAP